MQLQLKRVPSDLSLEVYQQRNRCYVNADEKFIIPSIENEDMSEVDVILISNASLMLALPYITERTNFRGDIYATEPALTFGRLHMEELEAFCGGSKVSFDSADSHRRLSQFRNIPRLKKRTDLRNFRSIYSTAEIQSSLAKVRLVGQNESLNLFDKLSATPHCSGDSIGSVNWVISTNVDKITYLSASSCFSTHPKSFSEGAVKGSNTVLVASTNLCTNHDADAVLADLLKKTDSTLRQGGNVLIVSKSSAQLYDLIECVSSQLTKSGHHSIPMYTHTAT